MSSADKLTIETPEQTLLEFPLAGIGSRFLALAGDLLLQTAFFIAVIVVAMLLSLANLLSSLARIWLVAIVIFIFFLIQFAYFALFESLWNGQTPGKRWARLRVIQDSGRPITPYEAILRNLLRVVDSLPSLYAVGIISILISRENKRLGDFAAGTVVIHEKPLEGVSSIWDSTNSHAQLSAANPLPQLTADELHIVETFLARRGSLEPDVRRSIAYDLSNRLGKRLNVPTEIRPDSEKFLEALAERRRNTARFS